MRGEERRGEERRGEERREERSERASGTGGSATPKLDKHRPLEGLRFYL